MRAVRAREREAEERRERRKRDTQRAFPHSRLRLFLLPQSRLHCLIFHGTLTRWTIRKRVTIQKYPPVDKYKFPGIHFAPFFAHKKLSEINLLLHQKSKPFLREDIYICTLSEKR